MCIHYGVCRTWLGAFCYLPKLKTVQIMNFQKIKEWVFKHKIISVVIFLILLGLIGIINTPTTPKATVAENNSATTTEVKNLEKTPEQKLTDAIINVVGEKTNMSKPRVISTELSNIEGGKQQAFVKVNASENLTSNLEKSTLNKEAVKITQAVFPVDPKIQELVIWSYLPVKDKYGNTKDDVVVIYSVSRSLFSKINWTNFDNNSFPDLLRSESKTDFASGYVEKVKF